MVGDHSGLVSAVPLGLFQHHHSAGFKPLSLSPFCIPTASPNEERGGDSLTPPPTPLADHVNPNFVT